MKVINFIICVVLTLNGFAQNAPPIAVNDTLYLPFNDSIELSQRSGSISSGIPISFLANDTEPNGNLMYVDNVTYNGLGVFNVSSTFITPTLKSSRLSSKKHII